MVNFHGLSVCTAMLLLATPCLAQSPGPRLAADAVEVETSASIDYNQMVTVLEAAADDLVRHVLAIDLGSTPSHGVGVAVPQARGGSGALGLLGTVSGSLGPIANSLSMITRNDEPGKTNNTSDALAATGAGLAIVGGVLQVYSMMSDDGNGSDMNQEDALAVRSTKAVRDGQRLAAGTVQDIERLLAESRASGTPTAEVRLEWSGRADRALGRAAYILRETRRELVELRDVLGEAAVQGPDANALAAWRKVQSSLSDFPASLPQ